MKKIVFFITRSDAIGGAQIHIKDMCIALKKENYIPYIIIGFSKGQYLNQLKEAGINVIISKNIKRNFNLYNDLKAMIFLIKIIKNLKPNIVSSHSFKAGFILKISTFFLKNVPTIFTAHGWSFNNGIPLLRRFISLQLEKILCGRVSKVITVCNADYKLALEKKVVNEKKLVNIYNGMPLKDYKLKNFNSHKIIKFISVARFESQKDHKTIIESFCQIDHKNWNLFLIGDGPNRKYIENIIIQKGLQDKVKLLGAKKNVEKYLNKCDVFVLSSLWEGFPRSILEAMRSSMPIIASNVGGCSESVVDSYNGFLVKPRDVRTMSKYISLFIDDFSLIKKFGTRSFRLFESKFTFKKMYEKTLKIYKEIES
tara:strand:- start:462 stop:1568 length:1107 start_codon:yes stop_codon:yes gene_type:complete